jgi:hypothetical protein
MVASLEPKLFCSVAMKERFASRALANASSYATIMSNG